MVLSLLNARRANDHLLLINWEEEVSDFIGPRHASKEYIFPLDDDLMR